jgi:Zn-finger nucleic acid-binding protein
MACPTCDHTMQAVDLSGVFHWCPRCGTLKSTRNWTDVPKLVERVRGSASTSHPDIVECVFTPMERAIKQGEAPG